MDIQSMANKVTRAADNLVISTTEKIVVSSLFSDSLFWSITARNLPVEALPVRALWSS